jgi:hypothetical protein
MAKIQGVPRLGGRLSRRMPGSRAFTQAGNGEPKTFWTLFCWLASFSASNHYGTVFAFVVICFL